MVKAADVAGHAALHIARYLDPFAPGAPGQVRRVALPGAVR